MKHLEYKEEINSRDKIIGLYIDRTLKSINSAYQTLFDSKEKKISTEQWVILMIIRDSNEPLSQTQIADKGFRNRATITRLLKALENIGFISKERFNNDSKRYKIVLTMEGENYINNIQPEIDKLRDLGIKNIDPEDYWIFREVLDQIYHNHKQLSRD